MLRSIHIIIIHIHDTCNNGVYDDVFESFPTSILFGCLSVFCIYVEKYNIRSLVLYMLRYLHTRGWKLCICAEWRYICKMYVDCRYASMLSRWWKKYVWISDQRKCFFIFVVVLFQYLHIFLFNFVYQSTQDWLICCVFVLLARLFSLYPLFHLSIPYTCSHFIV